MWVGDTQHLNPADLTALTRWKEEVSTAMQSVSIGKKKKTEIV